MNKQLSHITTLPRQVHYTPAMDSIAFSNEGWNN